LGCPGQAAGCLSEYLVMPERSLYPTAGRVTLEQAALCEPLSIGVYAVRGAGLMAGANVAILGAGPIGLSVLLAARAQGAGGLYLTDKLDYRVQAGARHGASWAGNPDRQDVVRGILERQPLGMDAVFECAGEQDTLDQAVELLKPGGRLLLVGIPRTDRVSLPIDQLRRKEITLVNVRRQNGCVPGALDLVAEGRAEVDFMLTHRFPLERTAEAFELVDGYRDGVIKALIEF
jgi:L-iditol 2-dehydrogenase